ncbi:MAG: hypothetical protein LUF01_14400 [Bacteroides sp.]|nr:hypothetical protein [Bacteroides sp.]
MRTHKIGDATVEYPDEIGFCFNPVVINIYGHSWSWIGVTVTDTLTNEVYNEKRALFKGSCFFDVSFYIQSSFDTVEFSKIDYSLSGAQDSRLGRVFSVEVDMYSSDNTVEQSFQFNTFIIWGPWQWERDITVIGRSHGLIISLFLLECIQPGLGV